MRTAIYAEPADAIREHARPDLCAALDRNCRAANRCARNRRTGRGAAAAL
jgi:hypothetical protein